MEKDSEEVSESQDKEQSKVVIQKAPKEFPCMVCGKNFNLKILWYHHLRKEHFEEFSKLFPNNPISGGRPKRNSLTNTPAELEKNFEKIQEEVIPTPSLPSTHRNTEDKPESPAKKKTTVPPRPPKDGDIIESDDLLDPLDGGPLKQKSILGVRSAKFSGEETHMAELLINNGFAKDFTDLNRKALRLTFSLMKGDIGGGTGGNMGFGFQQGKQQSVSEMLAELNRRELEEAEIELLKTKINAKAGNKGGKKMDFGEIMMMKMMFDGNNNQKSNGMDVAQMVELMKIMQSNQQPPQQNNSFSNFKEIMEMAKLMNPQPQNPNDSFKQNIEMFKTMLDNGDKGNQTKEILEFLKDRESNMYKSQTEIQKIKDEQYKMILDQKMDQLAKQVQSGNSNELDFNRIAEQIKVIKELGAQISPGEQKPSPIDYINSIGEAVGPVLSKFIEAKSNSQQAANNKFGTERFQRVPDERTNGLTEEQMMAIHRRTNVAPPSPMARSGVHHYPATVMNQSAQMEEEDDEQNTEETGEEESLPAVPATNPDFSPRVKRGKLIPDDNSIELPGYVG